MKFISFTILLLLVGAELRAQSLHGHVYTIEGEKEVPLIGASVGWQGTSSGTLTDAEGHFQLPLHDSSHHLVVRYVGYEPDTLDVRGRKEVEIVLQVPRTIDGVVITAKSSFILKKSTAQVEVIGKGEIARAACCNLSETFETNPTVDVSFSDAVTGAKQIRMLGLEGIYAQMLQENVPSLRGLGSTYGLSFIPGTWLNGISLTKGSGSVVNGYESISGQINLDYIRPTDKYKHFFNVYGDAMGRAEGNYHFSDTLNSKWGTTLLLHGSQLQTTNDRNSDGFLDLPRFGAFSGFNRWSYQGKRMEGQFSVNTTLQHRQGGQVAYDSKNPSSGAYGSELDIKRIEGTAKVGILFPATPYKSIGSQWNVVSHKQEARFGNRAYAGNERAFYGNLIYQTIIGHTGHVIKMGGSFLADDYRQEIVLPNPADSSILQLNPDRTELVPGAFAEYTYSSLDGFGLVAGLRTDYHNLFGLMLTPRLHMRYELGEKTIIRASGGRGYRTPNPWTEVAAVLASNRELHTEEIKQEKAWNFGGSILRDVDISGREGYLTLDYYYTTFDNQYIMDVYRDRNELWLYNSQSRAHSAQVELSLEPIQRLQFKNAIRYYDVQALYGDTWRVKPFVPRTRFLSTASYKTPNEKWQFDLTGIRHGGISIPASIINENVAENPIVGAKPYWLVHSQITFTHKNLEVYGGSENLLNCRQANPILGADDPFGEDFDATMVWAPIEGRRIYVGLRWGILKK